MKNLKYKDLLPFFDGLNVVLFEDLKSTSFNQSLIQQAKLNLKNGLNSSAEMKRQNIFIWEPSIFKEFKQLIANCAMLFAKVYSEQYKNRCPKHVSCWPNKIESFDGNIQPHAHHVNPFNITGIYYASGDFSQGMGNTLLWTKAGDQINKREIRPVNGSMVLFQGNCIHSVAAYTSSIPRITFAFDVTFSKTEVSVDLFA